MATILGFLGIINEGGHYFRYFSSSCCYVVVVTTVIKTPEGVVVGFQIFAKNNKNSGKK